MIVENRLEEHVSVIDGRGDIYKWYERSNIYLMTSRYEGTPNTLLDAIIYKLPVISTDVGDIRYFVRDGYNGYLHPVDDYKGIARSLHELIINNKKRVDMGNNGYNYIYENYSPDKIIEKYRELIDL